MRNDEHSSSASGPDANDASVGRPDASHTTCGSTENGALLHTDRNASSAPGHNHELQPDGQHPTGPLPTGGLDAVAELGRAALAGSSVSELAELGVASLQRRLEVAAVELYRALPSDAVLLVEASSGDSTELAGRHLVPVSGDHPVGRCHLDQAPLLVEPGDPLLSSDQFIDSSYERMLCVPVGITRAYGVLAVRSRKTHRFSRSEQALVCDIAGALGPALERRGVDDEIDHMAVHDQASGLANESLFIDQVRTRLFGVDQDDPKPPPDNPTVLVLEISPPDDTPPDDTAPVDTAPVDTAAEDTAQVDQAERTAKDRILPAGVGGGSSVEPFPIELIRLIGDRIKGCLRPADSVARTEHDRYSVMLAPGSSPEESRMVAERLIDTFASPLETSDGPRQLSVAVGMSLGAAPQEPDLSGVASSRIDAPSIPSEHSPAEPPASDVCPAPHFSDGLESVVDPLGEVEAGLGAAAPDSAGHDSESSRAGRQDPVAEGGETVQSSPQHKVAPDSADHNSAPTDGATDDTAANQAWEAANVGELDTSLRTGTEHLFDSPPSAERLLREADTAASSAAIAGGDHVAQYSPRLGALVTGPVGLEHDLRRAMQRDELHVLYQPTVELCSGAIVGAEAFVRWEHPERGLIVPSQFLPVAARSELGVELDRWVLNKVARQTAEWNANDNDTRVTVALNASGAWITTPDFITWLAEAMLDASVDPRFICIEFKEGDVLANPDAAVRVLGEARALGCTVALDDLGLGSCSIAELSRLPLDLLKIDRRLVAASADADPDTVSICELVVTLGHTLGLVVTALGLEHRSQVEEVYQLDCDLGQGYFFGKPMAADALAFRLRNQLLT